MMDDDEPRMSLIPAGSLLTVSMGAYSDYDVCGVFRAKSTIDAEELRAEWMRLHPKENAEYSFKAGNFLAWVAAKGLIEAVDCFEWYLTDDSDASEMTVEPIENEQS